MFKYVCFNISSFCNFCCPYCYRVGTTFGNVSLQNAKSFIDKLCELGCCTINITGGEPLLNPSWKEIVEYSYAKELNVILSTNGSFLDIDDEILTKIKVLALPLDSAIKNENDSIKGLGHYDKIISSIEKYSKQKYSFKLKINTVVTPDNIETLNEILSIVDYKNIIWKLFLLRRKGFFYNYSKEYKSLERLSSKINEIKSSNL